MRSKVGGRTLVQLACAALVAGALGGCGGGGGGATGQPASSEPTLVITSANSDAVGHFAAVAALSLPISWLSDSSVSLTGPAMRSAATAGGFARLQAMRGSFTGAGGDRMQALDAANTGELPCSFGGTVSAAVNDMDNNGAESPGDVETLQFTNCGITANETYNGSIRFDVLAVTEQSASYNVTLTQLSYVTSNHSLAFNGSYVASESMAGSSLQTTLTVNESVTVAVATHVPYRDTVTFASGFLVRDEIDYGAGRSVLAVAGRVESAFAGGSVDISTPKNLTATSPADPGMYPDGGILQVNGKAGALSITALSSASACVDTDSNDDGAVESTYTQSWDWLL